MDKQKLWKWLPRILALAFIVFISIFALDAFDRVSPWYMQLVGFLIHLIPTYALIAIYLVARKWPVIGGWIFIAVSVVFTFVFKAYEEIFTLLLIVLPFTVVGVLFILSAKFLNKGTKHKKHG